MTSTLVPELAASRVMASTAMASKAGLVMGGRAPRPMRCPTRAVATSASRRAGYASTSCSATATSRLDVPDAEEDDEDEDEPANREPTPAELDAEARVLLQWPELSAQVRAFTATTLGYRSCDPVLALGVDFEDSQRLLDETSGAAALRESGSFPREVFVGTRDIRPWVLGATRGRVLSGASLADIATTVNAGNVVWRAICGSTVEQKDEKTDTLASLKRLAIPLTLLDTALEPEIGRCVTVPGGNVKDEASDLLGKIREERRLCEQELRTLLLEKANYLARKNFAERAQVVSRLGRECIPMKAGSQNEMEGVVLGVSGTGATVFKEPIEATPLNNRLMELGAEEEAEVELILKRLTSLVMGRDEGKGLLDATEALARIDLANARAEHSEWLSGCAPTLFEVSHAGATNNVQSLSGATNASPGSNSTVFLPGMQHPLLLQPRLTKLPRGGEVGKDEEVAGWDDATGPSASTAGDDALDDSEEDESSRVQTRAEARDVVPVDFNPPSETRLVAITGPNTGGKTASLKALGLFLLMARAGLHLPTDATKQARVPWTSRVLADLGDAQSLALDGGLSTFSAHLTRLRRILAAAADTADSVVVLLDEPGGGTDPAEGAALAVAVLKASASRAALTVATSHYEEVKAMAVGNADEVLSVSETETGVDTDEITRDLSSKHAAPFPGAANAAVEFDTKTLRPTYRLLWGVSGESNALAVARGLGLEDSLADAAERRWRRSRGASGAEQGAGDGKSVAGEDLADLAVALKKERDVQQVRAIQAATALSRTRDLHADVLSRGAARLNLRTSLAVEAAFERGVKGATVAKATLVAVDTREALDSMADLLMPDGWMLDVHTGDAVPGRQRRRRHKRPASVDPKESRDDNGVSFDSFDSFDDDTVAWLPHVGAKVTVRRMGDAEAEVVELDASAGEVVVRMGSITTRAPLTGVSPVMGKK